MILGATDPNPLNQFFSLFTAGAASAQATQTFEAGLLQQRAEEAKQRMMVTLAIVGAAGVAIVVLLLLSKK